MPASAHVEPEIRVNPRGIVVADDARFVSRCLGTSWSVATYRWYLRRSFAGAAPDRLILTIGDRPAAGCGLAYRFVQTPDNALHPVGVIVAAGTLPEDRGQGYYARLLQAAAQRGAAQDCVAVIGFVTATNASARGLQRLGATAIPSYYIAGDAVGPRGMPPAMSVRPARSVQHWAARTALGAANSRTAPFARFYYPDATAWRSQHLTRPNAVNLIRCGATTRALIEIVGETDRLQWLDGQAFERIAAIGALAARARRSNRGFFMYSTSPADGAGAGRLGLRVVPGFLMALATQTRHEQTVRSWSALPWRVQSGDRL
jgi:ribosomal protein S18 acetylase RimI-like enzyme